MERSASRSNDSYASCDRQRACDRAPTRLTPPVSTHYPSSSLTGFVESKRPSDLTAQEHARDAQQNGDDEPARIADGRQELGDHANDQPDTINAIMLIESSSLL